MISRVKRTWTVSINFFFSTEKVIMVDESGILYGEKKKISMAQTKSIVLFYKKKADMIVG